MKADKPSQTKMELPTEMVPLTTKEGLRAFETGLTLPGPQMMVIAGDPDIIPQDSKPVSGAEKKTPPKQQPNAPKVKGTVKAHLQKKTGQYLKEILAREIKLPAHKIDANKPLEKYGIHSVMILSLNRQLETDFGSLSKTLFFEYQSITALTGYFMENHRDQLTAKFGLASESAAEKNRPPYTPTAHADAGRPRFLPPNRLSRIEQKEDAYAETDDIAIIGLAGRYPMAEDLATFWENLKAGQDCIAEIPPERWDHRPYFDPDKDKPGKSYSKWGGFMADVDKFDPLFFNISAKEAELLDPQERLFLQTVWQTLEDAGYTRRSLQKSRVGVYVGVMWGQYQLFVPQGSGNGQTATPGSSYASIANRVSYFCDFHGPSMALDTMCSSSLTAIHLACEAIKRGECELAVAGGVNLTLHPAKYLQLSQLRFAASDGRCRSFGEGGDGYVPGEGVGAVLLKPLTQAVAHGDHIYGVVRASAVNHGGKTNGYTVPSPAAQTRLVLAALQQARIDPRAISYLEAHGTGTSLGDPIEITGLINAFKDYTPDRQFCAIGSVKSNIGHLESAAGIAGLTKVLLQMKHQELVPSIHSQTLNPHIDFEDSPFYVQQELSPWNPPPFTKENPEKRHLRLAGISSFGAGGANAHLIIEEYEKRSSPVGRPDAEEIIVLSAKNENRLKAHVRQLIAFLSNDAATMADGSDGPHLADIAYTLQVGREAMAARLALVTADKTTLAAQLKDFLDGRPDLDSLFWGNVKTDRTAAGLLDEDDDAEEMIQKWARGGKLAKLAELWVNGGTIDWQALPRTEACRRISLPPYPFFKERYWISDAVGQAQIGTAATNSTAKLHSLIDSNISTLKEQSFKKVLRPQEFYLRDHVVAQKCLLPAVVYLEMARVGGDLARPDARVARIEDVVWEQPVALNGTPHEIRLRLFAEGDAVAYEVSTPQTDHPGQVHARGRLSYAGQAESGSPPEFLDIAAIQKRCGNPVSGTACYEVFQKNGFAYGPALQSIQTLYRSDTEALAHLVLPTSLRADFDEFGLHPTLMDGALQTVLGWMVVDGDPVTRPLLPLAMGAVEIRNRLPEAVYVHVSPVSLHPQAPSGLKKFDIQLADASGRVAVKIKELALRALPRKLAVAQPGSEPQPADRIYFHRIWEEMPLASDTEDFQTALKGHFLVFDSNEAVRDILKQRPEIDGSAQVVLVKPGAEFQELGDRTFEVDPESQTDYRRLMDTLARQDLLPKKILHLWSRGQFTAREEALRSQVVSSIHSVVFLSQALMAQKTQEPIHMAFVYPGSHEVPQPAYGAVAGFAKTIAQENPLFSYKTIAMSALVATHESAAAAQSVVDTVLPELQNGGDGAIEIRYHNGRRWVSRLEELRLEGLGAKGLPLKEGGVYVITGGSGGLGAILAEHLARQGKIKLVLTGRSPLTPQAKAQIEQLKSLGSQVQYVQGDVARRQDADKLIARTRSEFGPVNGLFHCAGVSRDAFILKKTPQELAAVLAPKVFGSVNLDAATQNEPLDFFVLFSSLAGALGNVGQADYAYANAFMDTLAAWRDMRRAKGERSGKTLSINWPLWEEGSMGLPPTQARLLAAAGMVPLGSASGLKALADAFAYDGAQMGVLQGDAPRLRLLLANAGLAESVKPERAAARNATPTVGPAEPQLYEKTEQFLKELLAAETKIPSHKIDSQEALEDYGIDSVMILNLNRRLETEFGQLSKTLLFEYQRISELTDYFVTRHAAQLKSKFGTSSRVDAAPISVENQRKKATERPAPQRFITPTERYERGTDIAIIGAGGRYPMANNLEEFWENLKAGRDCITEIPRERWDYRPFYDPQRGQPGKTYSKWGGFIDDVDAFDPLLFNISPSDAEMTDPQERLFLETVWETLEDAGYTKTGLADVSVGVFVGVMWGQYQLFGAEELVRGNTTTPGTPYASIANRVSYYFDFDGPSMALDTMCSSSLMALHLACETIQRGDSDLAIAGGVNVSIHPIKYLQLSHENFLASDGRCRSFGQGGDGYVPGEGVGAILLKPLAKAVADGDHIYAVVKGSSVNHGGKTNGYTVPNPKAQAKVVTKALAAAKIDPQTISYIEAHGTGTELGDPIEITGLTQAFGVDGSNGGADAHQNRQFCAVGSVKSNIGHLEAAAGIAGLTKVLLQMKHRQLVPSLHAEKLNPNIRFEESPCFVQRELAEWRPPVITEHGMEKRYPRRAGISSFGAGGTNAHIVLEEYEAPKTTESAEPQQAQLIVLSAKNKERLTVYAARVADFLAKSADSAKGVSDNPSDVQGRIEVEIRQKVCGILNVAEAEVDVQDALAEYGFDGVYWAELAREVNTRFDLEVAPEALSACRSIRSVAQSLWQAHGAVLRSVLPTPMAEQTSVADRIDLTDMAYTLQIGRVAMEERLALIVSSTDELSLKLEQYSRGATTIENAYYGNAKSHQDLSAHLLSGQEGIEFLKILIRNRNLAKLAQLWVSGATIDWGLLHTTPEPQRISLPTYPFAKKRYWFAGDDAADHTARRRDVSPLAAPGPARMPASAETIFCRSVWQKTPPPSAAMATETPGTLLIFDGNAEIRDALGNKLFEDPHDEAPILLVTPGDRFRALGNHHYEILPGDRDDFRQLAETLEAQGLIPDTVVHLWSQDGVITHETALKQQLDMGVYSLFYWIQALMVRHPAKEIRLLYLYNNHAKAPQPLYAAVGGLARTVHLENPRFICKAVEMQTDAKHLTASDMSAVIQRECRRTTDGDAEIRYQQGERWVKGLEKFSPEDSVWQSESGGQPIGLRPKGTYLITGGAGGLGLIFARYLAQQARARLVLCGRSERTPRITAKLEELESLGAEVIYVRADVSRREDVAVLVEKARARFGPINGIIHSAGTLQDAYVVNKTAVQMKSVLAPKVHGTLHLDLATKDEPLDFFVLFSSLAAVIGHMGQSDYAFGNAFMDHFAALRETWRQKKERSGKTVSINWPLWQAGGMQVDEQTAKILAGMGISPLTAETGWKAFKTGLAVDASHFMVLEGDYEKIKKALGTVGLLSPAEKEAPATREPSNPDLSPDLYPDQSTGGQSQKTAKVETSQMQAFVERLIEETIAAELHMETADLDATQPFTDFGMDSIHAGKIIGQLNQALELDLIPTAVYNYPSMAELSQYICNQFGHTIQRLISGRTALSAPGAFTPPVGQAPATESVQTDASEKALQAMEKMASPDIRTGGPRDIAIIGMAGKFAGARNRAEFWSNLKEGKNSVAEIPPERWDVDAYFDPDPLKPNKTNSKWAGTLSDVDQFDPAFFNMMPMEAKLVDPQQRLFMEAAWEAMEDAGYTQEDMAHRRCGVFVGTMTGDYRSLLKTKDPMNAMAMLGNHAAVLPNRLSYFLNLKGPSLAIDTACSSSLVAVHQACQGIIAGEMESALVGGVYLALTPETFIVSSNAGMLAPDGRCKTFDQTADGIAMGEGVAVVMLKALDQAISDQDQIYGVIKGSGINQDGRTNGITAPNARSQAELEVDVYQQADIDPATITYVETHGTGTKLGDPVEMEGLTAAFRKFTDRKQFCALGALKPNIGHTYPAAGIASLVKVLLCLKYKQIPPNINFETENEHLHLADSPFYVNTKLQAWPQVDGSPRRAAISAFGYSGTNAHLVVEEYQRPEEEKRSVSSSDSSELILLSAKNEGRLRAYARKFVDFIDRHQGADGSLPSLADIAYTLQVGRTPFSYRLALIAQSMTELGQKLDAYLNQGTESVRDTVYVGRTEGTKGNGAPASEEIAELWAGNDLSVLAKHWTNGAAIDWKGLKRSQSHHKVPLPTYPFERVRCWISDATPRPSAKETVERSRAKLIPLFPPKEIAWDKTGHQETLMSGIQALSGVRTYFR